MTLLSDNCSLKLLT